MAICRGHGIKYRLRIGFAGAISQYHLTGWAQMPDAILAAICDVDESKTRTKAQAFGIPSAYANIITSMNLDGTAIPMVMNTDEDAIRLAVKTVVRVKPRDCRIVRIRNTLELAQIQVSEPLLAEVRARPDRFQIAAPAVALEFDGSGQIVPMQRADGPAAVAAGGRWPQGPRRAGSPQEGSTPRATMRSLVPLFALLLLPAAPATAQTTMKEVRKACATEAREQRLEGSAAKKFREQCVQTRSAGLNLKSS